MYPGLVYFQCVNILVCGNDVRIYNGRLELRLSAVSSFLSINFSTVHSQLVSVFHWGIRMSVKEGLSLCVFMYLCSLRVCSHALFSDCLGGLRSGTHDITVEALFY